MLDNSCTGEMAFYMYMKVQWFKSERDILMIRDTAMHVNLIFCIFLNRGGNFNKDYDRKMVTKVWLDSVGVAFISVFCRNIVHFLKGLI